VQRQIRRVVAAVGGTMNGGDNDHDDDDEDDAIVDVDGDDDDDDDERSHDDDDVHTSGSSGANRSGDDDDDDDGDGDDNSDSIQIDDERADRHHRADRSTRGAASARVRRSTRKSTPVVRKSTSRHPHSVSAAATPSTAVAKSPDSADAAHGAAVVPRKRGRPPRVPRKEDANGDVVGAVEPASTDEHTTSPLPVGDSDAHSAKRTRIGTATSARPRTRRSERATSAHQRRGAAVDDDVQDDDEDQIDEFDDGDDDDNDENDDDDDDDDDDESVNMHLKKSLRGVAVSTRSLRGAHSKADDGAVAGAWQSARHAQRRWWCGGATAAAAAAATSSTTNAADAIVNRTRSARGTLPPPQSHNGDTVRTARIRDAGLGPDGVAHQRAADRACRRAHVRARSERDRHGSTRASEPRRCERRVQGALVRRVGSAEAVASELRRRALQERGRHHAPVPVSARRAAVRRVAVAER
jgi:hypothetical protein